MVVNLDESIKAALSLLFFILAFCVYFLPAIIAKTRKHKNTIPIELVNIFFGWTLLGWVIALIWSTMHDEKSR
jgi:RsiW-degrading membrane proteinase PrsW (M82 family)